MESNSEGHLCNYVIFVHFVSVAPDGQTNSFELVQWNYLYYASATTELLTSYVYNVYAGYYALSNHECDKWFFTVSGCAAWCTVTTDLESETELLIRHQWAGDAVLPTTDEPLLQKTDDRTLPEDDRNDSDTDNCGQRSPNAYCVRRSTVFRVWNPLTRGCPKQTLLSHSFPHGKQKSFNVFKILLRIRPFYFLFKFWLFQLFCLGFILMWLAKFIERYSRILFSLAMEAGENTLINWLS